MSTLSNQGRNVSVTPAEGREFLEMARGFERAAQYSLKMGDWKVAGSNAIHCVISATDALLGIKHRVRSAGTRHTDAATLLRRLEPGDDAKKNATRFLRMVNKKSLLQYEGRPLTEKEARALVTDAKRFLEWVEGEIR
jgi:HEPN domain-containing protein